MNPVAIKSPPDWASKIFTEFANPHPSLQSLDTATKSREWIIIEMQISNTIGATRGSLSTSEGDKLRELSD
jgi:hypothetical protein